MALSRVYMPSISLVLEEEPQCCILEPESSVLIPVDVPPKYANHHLPYISKPVNMVNEELEGDEHFSFVVHFPQGTRPTMQQYNVVGQPVKEQRPYTSRGHPDFNDASIHSNAKVKLSISVFMGALRKLYPSKTVKISSTL
uniref:Uncharacterized protein n=1 Tax=Psilocybe cubensis TaxID=181762 RepID=A0A8H8CNJ1_PSICU